MVKRFVMSVMVGAVICGNAFAANMPGNVAVLGALDKVTGRVSSIEVEVGTKTKFLALDIMVQACYYKPPEEAPDNMVFLNITEKMLPEEDQDPDDVETKKHFNGWMYSSAPAISALEHPVYDIWSIECKNVIEEEVPEEVVPPVTPAKQSTPTPTPTSAPTPAPVIDMPTGDLKTQTPVTKKPTIAPSNVAPIKPNADNVQTKPISPL